MPIEQIDAALRSDDSDALLHWEHKSSQELIDSARQVLRNQEYATATRLARLCIQKDPKDQQGWRLFIESMARGDTPIDSVIATFHQAYESGYLDDKAVFLQANHIVKGYVRRLVANQKLRPTNLVDPSYIFPLFTSKYDASRYEECPFLATRTLFNNSRIGIAIRSSEQLGRLIANYLAEFPDSADTQMEFSHLLGVLTRCLGADIEVQETHCSNRVSSLYLLKELLTRRVQLGAFDAPANAIQIVSSLPVGANFEAFQNQISEIAVPKQDESTASDITPGRVLERVQPNADPDAPKPYLSAPQIRREADSRFKKKRFKEAFDLYFDLFRMEQHQRTLDQLLKCYAQRSEDIELETKLIELGSHLQRLPNNLRWLAGISSAIANANGHGRVFRTAYREQAEDFLRSAIRSNIADEWTWNELSLILLTRRQFEDADQIINEFADHFPDSSLPSALKSALARFRGNFESAEAFAREGIEKSIRSHDRGIGCYIRLAEALLAAGRAYDARTALADALRIAPQNSEAQRLKLQASFYMGAPAHGLSDARRQGFEGQSLDSIQLVETGVPSPAKKTIIRFAGELLSLKGFRGLLLDNLNQQSADPHNVWCVFSNHSVSSANAEQIVGDTSVAVGVHYTVGRATTSRNVRPPINEATIVAARASDLLEIAMNQTDLTCIETLEIAARRLRSICVDVPQDEDRTRLGINPVSKSMQATKTLCSGQVNLIKAAVFKNKFRSPHLHELEQTALREDCDVAIVHSADLSASAHVLQRTCDIILVIDQVDERVNFDPEIRELWQGWLHAAASVIVCEAGIVEWLEDQFRIGAPVYESQRAGYHAVKKFLSHKFLLSIGAGIGNLLQATPLIRHIATQLGHPIDVSINSPVPVAHELLSECEFVNLVFDANTDRGRRDYHSAFISSTAGNRVRPIRTDRYFSQRFVFDFYTNTQLCSEARYNFLGLHNVLGTQTDVDKAEIVPFVRNHSPATRISAKPRGMESANIALAAGKTDPLWGKRGWPHFAGLRDRLKDHGSIVHSLGAHGEFLDGCLDQTHLNLRDTIRLLNHIDVAVAPDGGMFHLFDALGVPTVSIFGPTSVVKNGPMVSTTAVIMTERACSPCQFRSEFYECKMPVCMQDSELGAVFEIIRGKLEVREQFGELETAAALENELKKRDVLVRDHNSQAFVSRSLSLLEYANPGWRYVFDSCLKEHNTQRAEQIVNWRLSEAPNADHTILARSRLMYIQKKYDAVQAYCLENAERVSRPWMLRNFHVRALAAQQRNSQVAAFWTDWAPETEDALREDPTAWLSTATIAMRSMAKADMIVQARDLAQTILTHQPEYEPAHELLDQLDCGWLRKINRTDAKSASNLCVGVLSTGPIISDCLSRINDTVDIFHLKPADFESERADALDILLLLDDSLGPRPALNKWKAAESPAPGISAFARLQRHARKWNALIGQTPTVVTTRKKRVLVAANHHLEKWKPRGGERSTARIIQSLKKANFDVRVLVENKKNTWTGIEDSDIAQTDVVSTYVYDEALRSVIVESQPDVIISYGQTALKIAPVAKEMGIPYVFFPRDWGEVVERPHFDLVNHERVRNPQNRFKFAYDNAAKVITNAQYVGRVLKQIYDADSTNSYVPVSPPPRSFSPRPRREREYVLLINPRKFEGGHLVRRLALMHSELKFKVIGFDGEVYPSNVEVEPFFEGQNYCDMYENASVLLFPLGGDDPCGTGRVVFEALYCETPSLSLDRGGMHEVLPDRWLVKDNSPEAWSEALSNILEEQIDPQEYTTLMSDFEEGAQIETILNALHDVLNSDQKTH